MRGLSQRLLEDLKEAREQLVQTPTNSSRLPSSQPPWDRPSASDTEEAPLRGQALDRPDDISAIATSV